MGMEDLLKSMKRRITDLESRPTIIPAPQGPVYSTVVRTVPVVSLSEIDVDGLGGYDEIEFTYNLAADSSTFSATMRLRLNGVNQLASAYDSNQVVGGATAASVNDQEGVASWHITPADAARLEHNVRLQIFKLGAVAKTRMLGQAQTNNTSSALAVAALAGRHQTVLAYQGIAVILTAPASGYYTWRGINYQS